VLTESFSEPRRHRRHPSKTENVPDAYYMRGYSALSFFNRQQREHLDLSPSRLSAVA
jgi:hypothetical protein